MSRKDINPQFVPIAELATEDNGRAHPNLGDIMILLPSDQADVPLLFGEASDGILEPSRSPAFLVLYHEALHALARTRGEHESLRDMNVAENFRCRSDGDVQTETRETNAAELQAAGIANETLYPPIEVVRPDGTTIGVSENDMRRFLGIRGRAVYASPSQR